MKADLKTIWIMIGLIADIIVGSCVYNDLPISELKANIGKVVDTGIVSANNFFSANRIKKSEEAVVVADTTKDEDSTKEVEEIIEEEKIEDKKVYDNMTVDELANKLDRSLSGVLTGTGHQFASRAIELGVDPYMSVAIVLLETGCSYECSALVTQCYNVGGMRGSSYGCWGSDYYAFSSIEEGIDSYMNNLYYNYVAMGLTTPELINPKYAENTGWASAVNNYIGIIKSR